jgi:hypothetical protein
MKDYACIYRGVHTRPPQTALRDAIFPVMTSVFTVCETASRRLNEGNLLPKIIFGFKFANGVEVKEPAQNAA